MMPETIIENEEKKIEPIIEDVKTYSFEEQSDYIAKLKDENAKNRIKNAELKESSRAGNDAIETLKKIEETKLADEGKYKEILEAKDKELSEMKVDKELLDKYEIVFKKDLDDEIKGLGESTVKMILESGKPVADQLEMARAIRKESGLNSNSPASQKAGGGLSDSNGEDAITKEYNEERDPLKRANLYMEIKEKMPHLITKL